jgi:hypothetical protein
LRPFRSLAQVRSRGCSRRLERALTGFGAEEAFGAAAAKVGEHHGLEVGASRVRRLCLKHARRLAEVPVKPCMTMRGPGGCNSK